MPRPSPNHGTIRLPDDDFSLKMSNPFTFCLLVHMLFMLVSPCTHCLQLAFSYISRLSCQDEVDVSSVMTKGDGSVCAPMTHKEADRLDVMIELIFRYTYNVCHNKTGASHLGGLMPRDSLTVVLLPHYMPQ